MAKPLPFDFTRAMRRLCEDIAARLPDMRHVQMPQVAVAFAQARRNVTWGLQARLTPLRFEEGRLTTSRRGGEWTIQRFYDGEREYLYILTFYLPRFLEHSFREKMITVMHELYHISPRFDGDIRRLSGHYHVHSHSQQEYDRHMDRLVEEYLALRPPAELLAFLQSNFKQLHTQFGGIVGARFPIPRLIRVARSA